jgi:hypothetical protein
MPQTGLRGQPKSRYGSRTLRRGFVGRPEGPKAASLAERNATRRSKRLPECVKRANARGFAMDIKLITKPLMVKTQQPVEKVFIGPVGGPDEATNKTKTLQKKRI